MPQKLLSKVSLFTFLIPGLLLGTFSFKQASAGVSPLSIATFPLFQFPPADYTIAGLRMSLLWGEHKNVYGLDLGLIGNVTKDHFVGTSFAGIFNHANHATVVGAQVAMGANITNGNTSVLGFQLAGLMNNNTGKAKVIGFQMSALYNSASTVAGLQVGLVNRAESVYGLQLGFANFAKALHGIQIGLLNFNSSGILGFFPVINIGI